MSLFALGKALLLKLIKQDDCTDEDVRAWSIIEMGDKDFVETS